MPTMAEVKARAAASTASSKYFTKETMEWFGCRTVPTVLDAGAGEVLFLTSDRLGPDENYRWYNLRHQAPDGNIQTVLLEASRDLAMARRIQKVCAGAARSGEIAWGEGRLDALRAYAEGARDELASS